MDKFCLKWNEFEANLTQSFRELRGTQKHLDVTLATDDGHQIEAHKIILSAGSDFFSDIFSKTNHPSPFIYLKGIKKVELESIIDFMYNGEALVAQDELNKFLEIALELQVKGLQNNMDNKNEEVGKKTVPLNIPRTSETESTEENITEYFTEVADRKMKPINVLDNIEPNVQNSFDKLEDVSPDEFDLVKSEEDNFVSSTNPELDFRLEQMISKNLGQWQCKVCGKTAKRKQVIRDHAETHINGVSHSCNFCSKLCTTRNSLKVHIFRNHSKSK